MKRYLAFFLIAFLAKPIRGQQDHPSKLDTLLAAAQQAQAQSEYATAAADYKKAVKFSQDIPELWANLGLMEHETGDYAEAIQSFEKANRLNPSLYVPNLFLGIDYVRLASPREAIPPLQKARTLNETDPLSSLTLGRAYSLLRDYRTAIREYRRALRLDPKQSSAWFALGIAYLHVVEEDSRTITSEDAGSPYAKALFAEALARQSRYVESADLYKSVLAANDQPPCIRSESGFLYLKQGDTPNAASEFKRERDDHPECTLSILGEARLSVDAGSNEDALALFLEAWDRDRDFVVANARPLLEGVSAEHLKIFEHFLNGKLASNKIDPGLSSVLLQEDRDTSAAAASTVDHGSGKPSSAASAEMAKADYLSGHYGLCAGRLRGSLAGGNSETLRLLAVCSFFAGDSELSFDAGFALRQMPRLPKGVALYWSIKTSEKLAFSSLARFEQLEPDSARSHILLGDIYRQRKRYADAQKEYAIVLELSPNDPGALFGLASAYFDDAKTSQALEAAQRALLQNPADPEVNLLMGEVLVAQHKSSEAESYLLKSMNAKPQALPHIHALLGKAYAADGELKKAISELKMGLENDEDGSVHYQLARLYIQIGNKEDGEVAMEQTKVLLKKRRENAAIALQDEHSSSLDDGP